MLIDNVKIKLKAGDGGAGAVAFNKNKMALGPVGGNGGRGGDIYLEGISNLSALSQFRHKKDISSDNGNNGRGNFIDGRDGEEVILKVPVGTVITNLDSGESKEVVKVGERILIAEGGQGGRGNFKFRSAINTSPEEFEYGKPGQAFTAKIELKLIADVGFIGLPNAGKSSLLNELTSANIKVANYPFTTLEPNLGAYYGLILADIPGLIEGASGGKGLGIKFLKHIERTKILFHLVSAESEDVARDYKVIRKELEKYSNDLVSKKEYLFLSKYDLISDTELKKKMAILKKINKSVEILSIHDIDALKKVKDILNSIEKDNG